MKASKKEKAIVISNPQIEKSADKVSLLRIILTPEYTRIDFGYQATDYYIKGGWVQIHKTFHLLIKKSKKKFFLTNVENITIVPEKHYFNTTRDYLFFTLYFPAIPPDTDYIDVIEKENDDNNFFNFYQVAVNACPNKETILSI